MVSNVDGSCFGGAVDGVVTCLVAARVGFGVVFDAACHLFVVFDVITGLGVVVFAAATAGRLEVRLTKPIVSEISDFRELEISSTRNYILMFPTFFV